MLPNWVIGVILSCVAAILSNLGLNLQKLNHITNDRYHSHSRSQSSLLSLKHTSHSPYPSYHHSSSNNSSIQSDIFCQPLVSSNSFSSSSSSPSQPPHYTSQKIWRIGILFVVLGALCDFTALVFAAQSIVAPLGSLTLVCNTVIAPFLLGEKVSQADIVATLTIVAGTTLSIAFASHTDRIYSLLQLFELFTTSTFIIYLILILILIFFLHQLITYIQQIKQNNPNQYPHYMKQHRFAYAALSGTLGAQSVLLAKVTGQMLVDTITGGDVLFAYISSYVILIFLSVTICLQIHYLNEGLQRFSSLSIVPVFQSFWILFSVCGGMVFFGEWRDIFLHNTSSLFFPIGVLITIAGVFFLSQRTHIYENLDNLSSLDSPSSTISVHSNKSNSGATFFFSPPLIIDDHWNHRSQEMESIDTTPSTDMNSQEDNLKRSSSDTTTYSHYSYQNVYIQSAETVPMHSQKEQLFKNGHPSTYQTSNNIDEKEFYMRDPLLNAIPISLNKLEPQ